MMKVKIKEKIISIIISFILLHTVSIHINCIYRHEAYKVFDRFTLVDLFNKYKKQLEIKSCSLTGGPNCFYLSSLRDISDSEYLQNIINKLLISENTLDTNNVLKLLKKELKKFKESNKASMSETFKFTPKIMMNLLLNFESFDQTTKEKDVYMPGEKVINFNMGYLKLNFKGKLRLTADRENTMKKNRNFDNAPSATYGVIEDKDLFIKFDKPVIIKYLYARPHANNKEVNRYKTFEFKLTGYKNEKVVFQTNMHMIQNNREWYKMTPPNTIIDAVRFPANFEVDDISISHDSEYSDDGTNDGHLSSILQNMIEELVEQSNKNNITEDDV